MTDEPLRPVGTPIVSKGPKLTTKQIYDLIAKIGDAVIPRIRRS